MDKQNRRNFLKTAGFGAVTLTGLGVSNRAFAGKSFNHASENSDVEIGVATYSMRKLTIDQVVDGMKTMQLKKLSIKSMHLPLEASNEQISSVINKLKSFGMEPYSCGVVYMKSKEEVDNAFRYAKAAGFKIMVSVPNYELLDYVEQKVKENDIIIAIHNHGPDGLPYPSPQDVMERVKGRDKRLGICMDVAHVVRAGLDPVKAIKACDGRLHDLHLRDTTAAAKEGHSCRPGKGVIDLAGVMRALQVVGYKGVYCIEYSAEAENPVPGILETKGYLKGIADAI